MKNLVFMLSSFIVLLVLSTDQIYAQEGIQDKTGSPYFYIHSDNPGLDQMPLKETSAEVNIVGVIADVVVRQVYENNGSIPIEATYIFPGSTNSAVYGMEMKIGDKTIVASVKERGQARKDYNKAKKQGKRVSLLEQERPNVFQMQVANILPGDVIEVVLKYTEMLIPEEGFYEFVYPTVVGPRYTGESKSNKAGSNDFLSSGYSKSGLAESYDFKFDAQLNAGMPIQLIESPSHELDIKYTNLTMASIGLVSKYNNTGNKDIIIRYQLAGQEIESGLVLYEGEDENFFSLIVQPPKRVELEQIPSREYVFIIDISGSMNGFPIEVTKTLLRNLLTNLRTTDRFNILLFAGSSLLYSTETEAAIPENINSAIRFIDNQRGGGGTNLLSSLKRALSLERCEYDIARSLVIVTDGYVSVEKEAFDLIRNNLDQANMYVFGIGKGVNRYLLEGMAHIGQGEALIVTSKEEADEKAELFRKYISSPVLTQIKAKYSGFEAYDVEPVSIPDVLAERPVVIFGKWRGEAKGKIKITGYSGRGRYKKTFNVASFSTSKENKALKYLWARSAIKRLGDYEILGTNKPEITRLGLRYNLLTSYTSFIAIDDRATDAGENTSVKQVLPLPQGVPNSAVGFESEISGVSRASRTKTKKQSPKQIDNDSSQLSLGKRWTIGSYAEGDLMYVWAKSGFRLRAEASTNSKVIGTINYAEGIHIVARNTRVYKDKVLPYVEHGPTSVGARPFSIRANWVKVQTQDGKVGYVTDHFLLSIKPYISSSKNEELKLKVLKSSKVINGVESPLSRELTYQGRVKAIVEEAPACTSIVYEMENFTLTEALVLISSTTNLEDYNVVINKKDKLKIRAPYSCTIEFTQEEGKVIVLKQCPN